jgi:hypothetical protein
MFFLRILFFQAPENNIRVVSNFFKKYCSMIFSSQGTPLVSIMGNLLPVSTTPVANLHWFQQHRWQICRGGWSTNKFPNLQICKFAGLQSLLHLITFFAISTPNFCADLKLPQICKFFIFYRCIAKTNGPIQIFII